MGIESRDWYREETRRASSRRGSRGGLILGVLVGVSLLLAVSPPVRDRLGYELPFGLEGVFQRDSSPGALRFQPVPGGPSFTLGEQPLYARDDPWRDWLAHESTCPGGENAGPRAEVQVQVMLCLVNYARGRQGLQPLVLLPVLNNAAGAKAAAIARCGTFKHEACGQPADHAARALGYRRSFGENLYMAEGRFAAPRVALDGWLNSKGHRENLFRPEWRTIGIALLPEVDVEPVRDGTVWVNQFGD